MNLKWLVEDEKIVFGAFFESGNVPLMPLIKRGTELFLENGRPAKINAIILLIEEERAIERYDGTIEIAFADFLRSDHVCLSDVGLPPRIPYSLEVRGSRAITDESFEFLFELIDSTGQTVVAWSREGAILSVGKRKYTIPEPFYSLIVSMDQFNKASREMDYSEKFSIWADLKGRLPEMSIKDEYLRRMEIRRADSFTLNPYLGLNGTVEFDPHLLLADEKESLLLNSRQYQDSLPEAIQNDFTEKFRRFESIRPVYSMRGGFFCVVSQELQKVLKIVKKYQNAKPAEKVGFARNPKIFLKEELCNEITEGILEELFQETEGYSERVKEIGLWSPPIIPFLKSEPNEWFAGHEIYLRVEDTDIAIKIDEIGRLEKQARENLEKGIPSVDVNGKSLPAIGTLEALKTVKELSDQTSESQSPNCGAVSEENLLNSKPQLALNVFRNLDSNEFKWVERLSKESCSFELEDLKNQPLSHQAEAIKILQNHWISGSPGMLMADDMGLGKTFQTLAFLNWVKKIMHNGLCVQKPFLLVAPTGLIENWKHEHNLHLSSGGLGDVLTATGKGLAELKMEPIADRFIELKSGFPALDINRLQNADWVITTYETLRDFQFSFARVSWGIVVFDEMQKIKNPKTRMTDAAKALKADFIIGLTGTPVENKLLELWCLIDTIKPCYLGSLKQFVAEYESDSNSNSGSQTHDNKLNKLYEMLTKSDKNTPLMIRRMKSDHLKDLPEKREFHFEQQMPDKQAIEYMNARNLTRAAFQKSRGDALAALHGIKNVSLHPDMISDNLETNYDKDDFISSSARLAKTFAILDDIAKIGEKALIFCESRRMQGILAEMIVPRYKLSHIPIIINGEISGSARKRKVDIFQSGSGFDVMILSPKAGGVGLTLTAANHVIHLTRWWNPAVEDQCTDRVFRIGQKKTVKVYFPKAIHPALKQNSFDSVLNSLLQRKRELNKKALSPIDIGEKEITELFKRVID